jgi:hypothetical protein
VFNVKRPVLISSLWLPLVLAIVPVAAQATRQDARPQPAAAGDREPSRLQMGVMEDAFQRAVEATHGRAVEAMQVAAGMPALFTFEGNTRARAFRLEGYGVFFDVDLPPIPRSVEWQLRVLDTGAMLQPDIEQLQRQLAQINDPRVTRALAPILKSMQSKVSAGSSMAGASGGSSGSPSGVRPTLVGDVPGAAADPFRGYINELKRTLVQVMLEYGPSIRLGAEDWLHVAAREMSPRLMPGNPTEATLTLRIKAGDLAAFKAGRLTHEEAARRVDVKEVF